MTPEDIGIYGGAAGAVALTLRFASAMAPLITRLLSSRAAGAEAQRANQQALSTATGTAATAVNEYLRQLHKLEQRVEALEKQLEQRTRERDEAITAKHAAIVDRDLARAAADRAQAALEKAVADRDAAIARRDEVVAIAAAWEARAQEAVAKARDADANTQRWLAHANGSADELGRLLQDSWASSAHAGLESEHFDQADTLPPIPKPSRVPRDE